MRLLATTCLAVLTFSAPAQAGMVVSFTETNGGGVQAVYSGNLNLAALGLGANVGSLNVSSGFAPMLGWFVSQADGSPATIFSTSFTSGSGWEQFGSGVTFTDFDSTSGDLFGIFGNLLAVDQGYVSGAEIAGTATKNSGSFASLGLSQGTFTTTFSAFDANNNEISDFVTIAVGSTIGTVPEPASASLWGLGLVGLVFCRKRRAQNAIG